MQTAFNTINAIFKKERETCSECGGHILQTRHKRHTYDHTDFGLCTACFAGEVAKIRSEMRADYKMGGM